MAYILALVPRAKAKSEVYLSEGPSFILYKGEVRRYGIQPEMELTPELRQQLLTEVFMPRAKSRAMHLLEKQDYTASQLRHKLEQGGYFPEAIDAAIQYVIAYHYIDDERFARCYIRNQQSKRSQRRIEQDLMQKGVERSLISQCIQEEYTADPRIQIEALLAKKGYDPEHASAQERAKLYRFLLGKGFASGDICAALDTSYI